MVYSSGISVPGVDKYTGKSGGMPEQRYMFSVWYIHLGLVSREWSTGKCSCMPEQSDMFSVWDINLGLASGECYTDSVPEKSDMFSVRYIHPKLVSREWSTWVEWIWK